jgi:chloramphenicol-sensitive protein RarD
MGEQRQGMVYGVGAYGLWGLLIPLYFKAVGYFQVVPIEVLAHRVFWSFVVLAALMGLFARWADVRRIVRDHGIMARLAVSTLLLTANWLLFIYAVETNQLVHASLGYFVNPLLSVLLGVVFLHERLRRLQVVAIGLAAVGVLVLTWMAGHMPWLSMSLALSFGFYGLMRKLTPLDSMLALTVETMLLAPVGLAYILWCGTSLTPGDGLWKTLGLLMLSGPITTAPLLLFGAATRRLPLSTVGILQYITPMGQFLLAVLAFGEPFSRTQLISFACIWTATLIYTTDSIRGARPQAIEIVEPD